MNKPASIPRGVVDLDEPVIRQSYETRVSVDENDIVISQCNELELVDIVMVNFLDVPALVRAIEYAAEQAKANSARSIGKANS